MPYSFSGVFTAQRRRISKYPTSINTQLGCQTARITTGNNGGKFLFEAIEFQRVNCESLEKLFSNPWNCMDHCNHWNDHAKKQVNLDSLIVTTVVTYTIDSEIAWNQFIYIYIYWIAKSHWFCFFFCAMGCRLNTKFLMNTCTPSCLPRYHTAWRRPKPIVLSQPGWNRTKTRGEDGVSPSFNEPFLWQHVGWIFRKKTGPGPTGKGFIFNFERYTSL